MRKILSLFAAILFAASMMATTKTLYCKVAQDWWKASGAATGVYAYGDEGSNAAWPGVRMEPVAGEEDLWKAEIDMDLYHTVIFTRMNPSDEGGQDWGAKTADLPIPAENDLYTITSTTAVWGDPGVTGEWSVYSAGGEGGDPEPPVVNNRVIYLNIGGAELWGIAEAAYYIHAWGGNGVDVKMDAVSEGVFKAEIPENNANIVFVRMNPEATAIGWTEEEGMWNKTVDLEIPADKDLFTITSWDNGVWSVYSSDPVDPEPPVVNNRVIYLNDGGAELWGIAEAAYYIHAWGGNGVDVKMAAVSAGVFKAEIPENNTNLVFVRMNPEATAIGYTEEEGMWNKTVDLEIPADKDLFTITSWDNGVWSVYSEGGEGGDPEPPVVNNRVIYLNDGGAELWGIAEAVYYIHAWGGNEVDVKMAAVSEGVFKAEIPENNTNLVFVRMNPSATAIGWTEEEGMWNKTVDLEIPADKDLFTITAWDNGEWSVYSGTPSGIENTTSGVKATKVIRNGQIMIIKGENTYNMMGIRVK